MSNVENPRHQDPTDQSTEEAVIQPTPADQRRIISRPVDPDDQVDPAEYARLLDLYDNSFRSIAEGEVVKGTVLKVTENEVIVDVGYKSEGMIPVQEFLDEQGQCLVQPGDIVDVLLERTEDRDGYVVLSREKAEKMKIWDEVEKAYADRKVVIGRVIERIKGGLAVDIGVRAFLPGSQVDIRPVRNLDALKGQELRMRVIKVNKKRGNIVLSRKVLLEEENAEKKKTTLATLAEGKVLRGVVKNITDYGAFIDLGGIDGLLHITDMSWGRVDHPSELFKVNDEVDVIVLKYDAATERVVAGPQAAQLRSVERGRRPLPGERAGVGQGGQPDRLRRLRRARAGRRGAHPRLRDVVEQAGQAPVEDPQRGRRGGRDGARRGRGRAAHLARPQADRDQPVARPGGEVSRRHRASTARSAT